MDARQRRPEVRTDGSCHKVDTRDSVHAGTGRKPGGTVHLPSMVGAGRSGKLSRRSGVRPPGSGSRDWGSLPEASQQWGLCFRSQLTQNSGAVGALRVPVTLPGGSPGGCLGEEAVLLRSEGGPGAGQGRGGWKWKGRPSRSSGSLGKADVSPAVPTIRAGKWSPGAMGVRRPRRQVADPWDPSSFLG